MNRLDKYLTREQFYIRQLLDMNRKHHRSQTGSLARRFHLKCSFSDEIAFQVLVRVQTKGRQSE